jgi:hypothetical protein
MNDMNPNLAKEVFALSQPAFSGDLPSDWEVLKARREEMSGLLSRLRAVEDQSKVLTQLLNQAWDAVSESMETLRPSGGEHAYPVRPGGRLWPRN